MRGLLNREDMIEYHHGLGTGLRSWWRVWAGSRLRKYFADSGVTHPDDMSGVILDHHHDRLNGRKETWREWEDATKR
jgi:hypothetical protein